MLENAGPRHHIYAGMIQIQEELEVFRGYSATSCGSQASVATGDKRNRKDGKYTEYIEKCPIGNYTIGEEDVEVISYYTKRLSCRLPTHSRGCALDSLLRIVTTPVVTSWKSFGTYTLNLYIATPIHLLIKYRFTASSKREVFSYSPQYTKLPY